ARRDAAFPGGGLLAGEARRPTERSLDQVHLAPISSAERPRTLGLGVHFEDELALVVAERMDLPTAQIRSGAVRVDHPDGGRTAERDRPARDEHPFASRLAGGALRDHGDGATGGEVDRTQRLIDRA